MLGRSTGVLAALGASIADYFVSTRMLWMHYDFDAVAAACIGRVRQHAASRLQRLACDPLGDRSSAA